MKNICNEMIKFAVISKVTTVRAGGNANKNSVFLILLR